MLKTPLKVLLVASLAFPAALVTDVANAGHKKNRHHKDKHHHSQSYSYGGYYDYGRHHNRHHYRPHHYGYNYGGHYGHHGRHHGKAGKYLGVALLGLGVGYVLSKSNDRNRDYYSAPPPPPSNYYYNQPQGYATPQNYGAPQSYSAPRQQSFDFSQCRETREYQTTIYVDGQPQDAYGTACLMPDGNWVAGPMRLGY